MRFAKIPARFMLCLNAEMIWVMALAGRVFTALIITQWRPANQSNVKLTALSLLWVQSRIAFSGRIINSKQKTQSNMDNTDYQGDLNKAIIDAFDAYLKATKGREMNDKEIAAVLRTANDLVYDLDKKS